MAVRRAYDDTAKDMRRQVILDAADKLFTEEGSLPTAARLAETAGLAKGTLYLYFESRETVFATLLLERWRETLAELEAKLAAKVSRSGAVDAVLESFVTLIEGKPALMPLDAMLPEFKRGMSEEARRHFSASLGDQMARTGRAIERQLDLPAGRGFQLLVRSHAFARGLWQSCDADEDEHSTPADSLPSFPDELREALREYWRGALVLAKPKD